MQKKRCALFRVFGIAVIALLSITHNPKPARAFFKTDPVKSADRMSIAPVQRPSSSFQSINERNLVAQIGTGSASTTNSTGNDISLDLALKMILPNNWTVSNQTGEHKLSQKVRWKRNQTWVGTLHTLAEEHHLRFIIDWNEHIVSVQQAKAPEPSSVNDRYRNIGSIQKDSKLNTEMVSLRQKIQKSEIVPIQPIKGTTKIKPIFSSWVIKPGGLKNQLKNWCETSKPEYQLVWRGPDYSLDAGAIFTGDIDQAIQTLFENLRQSGAGLFAEIYKGNHVIVVKEI